MPGFRLEIDVMRKGTQNTIRKAYDRKLQMVVTAKEAAINQGFEPNRYVCVVCEEEVYVAAAYSTERSVHFRHHRGNNNVECEYYLGQLTGNTDRLSFKRESREVGEIYFDNKNRNFCLGLRFSVDEIEDCEKNNVFIELNTEDKNRTLLKIKINRENFAPDTVTLFPLARFSSSYYLSFSSEEETSKRLFFSRSNTPIFFRMMGHDQAGRCKYVRGGVLYTNIKYVVVFPLKKSSLKNQFLLNEFDVEDTFEFKTMDMRFIGMVLSIKYLSKNLVSLLKSWNYKAETSEALTILWPPTYLTDNKCNVNADYIYVYSSFNLIPKGNTNVPRENIRLVTSNVSRINLLPQSIIFKKNAEIIIEKKDSITFNKKHIQSYARKANVFKVPEDGLSYFMFNCYGVSQLTVNQTVYMTPDSLIIGYKHNYPVTYIVQDEHHVKCGNELLDDILAHYKKTENFDESKIDQNRLSTLALQYIKKCEIDGKINTVVRHYFEEGLL